MQLSNETVIKLLKKLGPLIKRQMNRHLWTDKTHSPQIKGKRSTLSYCHRYANQNYIGVPRHAHWKEDHGKKAGKGGEAIYTDGGDVLMGLLWKSVSRFLKAGKRVLPYDLGYSHRNSSQHSTETPMVAHFTHSRQGVGSIDKPINGSRKCVYINCRVSLSHKKECLFQKPDGTGEHIKQDKPDPERQMSLCFHLWLLDHVCTSGCTHICVCIYTYMCVYT